MSLERFVLSLWSHPTLDAFAVAVADYGLYVCAALFVAALFRARLRAVVFPLAIGAAAAAVLDVLAGWLHHDVRPFVAMHVAPLIPHVADNGFPSDHSAVAAFLATMTWVFDRRLGAASWVMTVLLGAARIFCLLHSPLDVVVGWTVGFLPALAVIGHMARSGGPAVMPLRR